MRLMQFVISGGLLNNFKVLDFFFPEIREDSKWMTDIFSFVIDIYFCNTFKIKKTI